MRLLHLPPNVRIEVQNGKLSAGHARALLAHPDPEQAAKIVIARGLNVRQTEALSAAPARDTGDRVEKVRDPETEALERDVPHPNAVRLALERRRDDRQQAPPVALTLPAHVQARDKAVRAHSLEIYDQLKAVGHEEP